MLFEYFTLDRGTLCLAVSEIVERKIGLWLSTEGNIGDHELILVLVLLSEKYEEASR